MLPFLGWGANEIKFFANRSAAGRRPTLVGLIKAVQ